MIYLKALDGSEVEGIHLNYGGTAGRKKSEGGCYMFWTARVRKQILSKRGITVRRRCWRTMPFKYEGRMNIKAANSNS